MKQLSIVALLLVVVATGAFGQAQRGSVTVTVEAPDGSRLPGATVTASSDQTLTRRTVITNDEGIADLIALDPAANYLVEVTLEGFTTAQSENVLVKAGGNTPLVVKMSLGAVEETLLVSAESPVVDVTNALTGQDLTLEFLSAVPLGGGAGSYQDALQLVPGVLPDDPTNPGNPASRSGVNYADIRGEMGRSSDNFYYIEGINVTDNETGRFGANLNSQVIQEQSVITGGVPAEFVGAPGLITNVVTKSGGNQFSASVNYFFQDDSLVADNKHFEDQTFSSYDTAATLGGPIVKDRLWFFASWRITNREDDVISPEGTPLRTVEADGDQGFGKLTWSATQSTLLSGTWLSDPIDFSGQRDNTISNSLNFSREQGADRYTANLSQIFDTWSIDAGVTQHEGDLNDTPVILEARNEVAFRAGDARTQAEEALGGEGNADLLTRSTEGIRAALEKYLSSSWGEHTLKIGAELQEFSVLEDPNFVDGAQYVSLSNRYIGQRVTAAEMGGGGFSNNEFQTTSTADFGGFIQGVDAHPRRAEIYARLDTNRNGVLEAAEVGSSLIYNSTRGNPHGQINHKRDFQASSGSREFITDGTTYYVQDTWQWNNWSVNAGVRAEEWEHQATTGQTIYTFDYEYAPRLSVAYDLGGQGRQRISGYYGRYYDPVRTNMTQFAGTLTGRVIEEQVFVSLSDVAGNADGEWVTFRTRGGATAQDAFFAPTTETPYTDEWQVGYKRDLGRNMSIEGNVIKRETRDILEDYDHILYMDRDGLGLSDQFRSRAGNYEANCNVPGCSNHPDSLFLGPGYLGFDSFSSIPGANFFIGTLFGGLRDWEGVEGIFRKRFSDNWQMIASYAYADAEGNTNSDSNADFQGDVLWLDPRAPNQLGTQPGLIEHLAKMAGSYHWDNGIQVGASVKFNSGTKASRTFRLFSRNLPVVTEGIDFADVNSGFGPDTWIEPGAVGGLTNDEWTTVDLRVAYLWDISERFEANFFLDVLNAFDDQAAIRNQDLEAGLAGFDFGEGLQFVDPQRFFLGVLLRY
jgi:hypothetical protein